MKNIVLLLVIVLLSSCDGHYEHRPIIISKELIAVPKVCKYTYEGFGYLDKTFDDSCNKYNIGDTIK